MTTHVFIVDVNTFKYHLEYMFAGTGAKNHIIDFNNQKESSFHHKTEDNLIGMIADSQRVRIGDLVIFYLQKNIPRKIFEGKFYGIFKVKDAPSFLDNNDHQQFLKQNLGKSLTFRTLIEPYQVYTKGVTEWEALDEIRNIHSPHQMLWSLIYRKLKGNRGNTMITIYESERLRKLIRNKNQRQILQDSHFTFNENTEEIEQTTLQFNYSGYRETINILPRLVNKYESGKQFETHQQAYILQNIENLSMFQNDNIEWIGNEVYCGVGMQKIDILLSIKENDDDRKVIPIELKSANAAIGITNQLQRYVDWIEQYYLPNRPSDIEPMIIARQITDKSISSYQSLIREFENFNNSNNVMKLRYVEFTIDRENQTINFSEIEY